MLIFGLGEVGIVSILNLHFSQEMMRNPLLAMWAMHYAVAAIVGVLTGIVFVMLDRKDCVRDSQISALVVMFCALVLIKPPEPDWGILEVLLTVVAPAIAYCVGLLFTVAVMIRKQCNKRDI